MISRHAEWQIKRKKHLLDWAEKTAPNRDRWRRRNSYYYQDEARFLRFLIPTDSRILEFGCGTGDLLGSLEPSYGVGIDISESMILLAKERYPHLKFTCEDIDDLNERSVDIARFDYVILADTIGYLEDIQQTLSKIKSFTDQDSRLIISYFSQMWKPLLSIAEFFKLKMPQPQQNWLSSGAIENLLELSGYEIVRRDWRLLSPRKFLGIGSLINASIAQLPGIRRLCLKNYIVARPQQELDINHYPTVSIIIPCRNEAGNIIPALSRIPEFPNSVEVIFVEGHSSDNTKQAIEEAIKTFSNLDITLITQVGKGKADAVWSGFALAKYEILMILDADLTVAPEDLTKFYNLIASGKAEFINGTRLIYPIENGSMRTLNFMANHLFARIFSWLLNQRMTDTLCGTKVLSAHHYALIHKGRDFFGNFDPFGDFDLIFGAAKLNLKIAEIPVRYADRSYGTTQISRFKDGLMLLKMVVFGYRKLKVPQ